MNKGITISCPDCKKILIRYAKVKGDGDFEMKCPYCQKTISVLFGQIWRAFEEIESFYDTKYHLTNWKKIK